jgi:phosphopentomutase
MNRRVIIIVLDSLGIGQMPDAMDFGDFNVNTFKSIVNGYPQINIPNLELLGISNIDIIDFLKKKNSVIGSYGYMNEASNGKDTSTGHWEIGGLKIDIPFKVFPDGFPDEIIKPFEEKIGRKILWNKPASGTEILDKFGQEHMETGKPIVYTSADSVFQIAAHEEIIPIDELYKMCQIARELLTGEYQVARVIARPFIGTNGNFQRTSNRHDYSIDPYSDTMLDVLKNEAYDVMAIGKIVDIFNSKGVTYDVHTKDNLDGILKTIDLIKRDDINGLIFTNLVDFDAKYGHRRDPVGYGKAIEEFDNYLPQILESLKDDDLLILTADHGNDPGYKGSDHTREYVPLLVYGKNLKQNINLGKRDTFADISATVLEFFNTKTRLLGKSFLSQIRG